MSQRTAFVQKTDRYAGQLICFEHVIDELAPTLNYLTFYFQGEPFLHPQFLEMVKYASDKGIYTATSTNAHFLKDDQAKATVLSALID